MTLATITGGKQLRADAAEAFNRLAAAFRNHFGYDVGVTSANRTRAEQERLYNGWVARRPGFNLAARPGTSLHEKGLSVDLASRNGQPLTSAEKAWLDANAPRFGFKPTGNSFRPVERWHFDYVPGSAAAQTPALSTTLMLVQSRLKTRYPLYAGNLVVDGVDGPKTRAAVKEFQRRSGLYVDGIPGPKTLKALGLA